MRWHTATFGLVLGIILWYAATAGRRCITMASLQELGAQFRGLRAQRGHFDGAAWNADVDKFDGQERAVDDLSVLAA